MILPQSATPPTAPINDYLRSRNRQIVIMVIVVVVVVVVVIMIVMMIIVIIMKPLTGISSGRHIAELPSD